MATRDRSQGIAFVYVDIAKLLYQMKNGQVDAILHPQEKTAKHVRLEITTKEQGRRSHE